MTTEDYKILEPELPHKPGVYRFYGKEDEILYVGKAKNLKKRVASYFTKNYSFYRIKVLVQNATHLQYTIVETEADALLLENSLIKKYQPKYNIQLKDDKTYPFLCIKNERFPRVFLTRKVIKDGSTYLGPYTSVRRVKTILETLKNIFPLRTCNFNLSEENINAGKFKVCLEYHLGNCIGPCEGFETEEHYNNNITRLQKILKGDTGSVITFLKEEMKTFSHKFEFEKAAEIKKRLEVLKSYQSKSTIVNPKIHNVDVFGIESEKDRFYVNIFKISNGSIIQTKLIEIKRKLEEQTSEILEYGIAELRQQINSTSTEIVVPLAVNVVDSTIKTITIPQRGDKLALLELAKRNVQYYRNQQTLKYAENSRAAKGNEVLAQLKNDFRLTELPFHIECFDNSNFQGSYPTSSCVVFKNGKPSKKDYRHYNVKTVEGPNDFASMEEVVYRRYRRLIEEEEPLPQLIIIDGGKGQLSSAVKSLKKLDIYTKVAIAGIAKRLEEIYMPEDSFPLLISKKSPSLKLIQQLRNEAHRFAISLHRKKRNTGTLKSELTDIDGIGQKSIEKLYKHFKSFEAIKNASEANLSEILDKVKAKKLKAHFDKNA